MARLVSPEALAELAELAGPLVATAIEFTEGAFQVDPGADNEAIAQAHAVTAAVQALQAVLQATPLSELGALAALASVSGTVLAQCQGDRRVLYEAFKQQFARVLAEVHEAVHVRSSPALGNG